MIKVSKRYSKKPQSCSSGAFLFRLGWVAYSQGWLPVLFISVQPFANIVGNYTRHNREKEWQKNFQTIPPFLHLYGGGSLFILFAFPRKSKLQIHWQGVGNFPRNVHFCNTCSSSMSDLEIVSNFSDFEKTVSQNLTERRRASIARCHHLAQKCNLGEAPNPCFLKNSVQYKSQLKRNIISLKKLFCMAFWQRYNVVF